jgi:hypothetical protein
MAAHAQELSVLRGQSEAALTELQNSHKITVDDLKASHESTLDETTKTSEKLISNLKIELKATQDDLAKAKASLASTQAEIDSLKIQLQESQHAVEQAASTSADSHAADLEQVRKEHSNTKDDLKAMEEALAASKETFAATHEQMTNNHKVELEEAAKGRADALQALKEAHEQDLARLNGERAQLLSNLEDEREAKEKALSQLELLSRTPPASPAKGNGVLPASVVPKEELEKLHQAHTLKVDELELAHKKALQAVQDELEESKKLQAELSEDNSRKALELNFTASEKDEAVEELNQ